MNLAADRSVWVRRFGENSEPRARLFCFPHAAGSAMIFRDWNETLPHDIEIVALQLPGREDRWLEPCITRMEELIQMLESVLSTFFDRPFAFFGHSLGALVAFELARSLQSRGSTPPAVLIASGACAPQVTVRKPLIHKLPKAQLLKEIGRLAGTPNALLDEPELMELLLPMIRADFKLYETYRYRDGPPLSSSIMALWGEEDKDVDRTDMERWQLQTQTSFELRRFKGNHFFIHSCKPAVTAALADILSAELLDTPELEWRATRPESPDGNFQRS